MRWSAGLGLRYFSVAGPIRFDIGFPLNPQYVTAGSAGHRFRVDDVFQVYISLGQAF